MCLQLYLAEKVPAEGTTLSEVKDMLRLYQDAADVESQEVVKELRRAAGAAVLWCRQYVLLRCPAPCRAGLCRASFCTLRLVCSAPAWPALQSSGE